MRLSELQPLRDLVRQFVDERDWDQFHTPKNLSAALSVEAAELLEHFQWLHTGDAAELGPDKLVEVRHEMADVLVYLVRLADKLDVDLFGRRGGEDGAQSREVSGRAGAGGCAQVLRV